jgi:hypothetical protein
MKDECMKSALLALALGPLMVPVPAVHAATGSPYAGQEAREIKALSASEVEDLLAGKGMGFAKAAELNGYPGPAHVLELSSQLGLSDEQATQTRALQQRMQADARTSGAKLVAAERQLELLFRSRSATPERLAASLQEVGALQAQVREAHLRAHIEQTRLLSEAQIARYNELRGYGARDAAPQAHRHSHDNPH